MVQERQITTAAAFDAWVAGQPEDRLFEFINGEVIEKAMVTKPKYGNAVTVLIGFLSQHLINHDIDGYVTGESSGYMIGNKRCIPDGALVLGQPMDDTPYSANTPVLIIEMISDDENSAELRTLKLKREIYLDAGITVWEGSTELRCVDVFTPDGRYRRVRDSLTLDVLPGLAIPLDKVFRS